MTRMLAVIANHNHNANAIALREGFRSVLGNDAILIDSGSDIAESERQHFDDCQKNIYYSGLLNCAFEHSANLAADDPILFICSDVEIADPSAMVARVRQVFTDIRLKVWGPSSFGSGHPQMWPRGQGKLRVVSFVEGFCFAARKEVLARICPVDLSINRLGWGLDKQLGYFAGLEEGYCAVDDGVEVFHPKETGYNTEEASKQRHAWNKGFHVSARCFQVLATMPGFRAGPGCGLLRNLTAGWGRLAQN